MAVRWDEHTVVLDREGMQVEEEPLEEGLGWGNSRGRGRGNDSAAVLPRGIYIHHQYLVITIIQSS